ncbi:MAG TPA: TerC family protein [Bdellovibrionota bacterium]|jgi:tellurite resistance protein TerC|nr:TerC family protein [Bdellovibrionota bacterium]
MPTHSLIWWISFNVLILALLALDLGVFNKKAHVIKLKEAALWSVFWMILGVGFGAFMWFEEGRTIGMEYLTGYVVEKSLSVDNLFVFLVIFRAFQIEKQHQHRLLFWGILGAIILRGIMIAAGTQLLANFHWVIYVFGAFLIYTGVMLAFAGDKKFEPEKSPIYKFITKVLPFTDRPHHGKLTMRIDGKRFFTLAFAALCLIEASDVMFALDSVPAVFGITRDPFIVYSSNIFAILGLRSLFFVLEDFMDRFHLLKYGLAIVLTFVGIKMCIEGYYKIPAGISLSVIGIVLGGSMMLSFWIPPSPEEADKKATEPL